MSTTLHDRLGGSDGIHRIVDVLVDNHARNPVIAPRFKGADLDRLKTLAAEFFIAGSGGPDRYDGKDMISAHRNMNISDREFMAVLDDAVDALDANAAGQREKEEVLFILYSLRPQVVHL